MLSYHLLDCNKAPQSGIDVNVTSTSTWMMTSRLTTEMQDGSCCNGQQLYSFVSFYSIQLSKLANCFEGYLKSFLQNISLDIICFPREINWMVQFSLFCWTVHCRFWWIVQLCLMLRPVVCFVPVLLIIIINKCHGLSDLAVIWEKLRAGLYQFCPNILFNILFSMADCPFYPSFQGLTVLFWKIILCIILFRLHNNISRKFI